MLSISQLDETVWSRVAAGEVVERPASAVKELVENSIDALSKRIRVSLKDGGRLRIVVEDDGSGIAFAELPLALAYHATSKISTLDDLEHITTLGYRGEALASLAAVADVEIRSRQKDSQSGGIIRTRGGKISEHNPASCPQGTRVQVDNLFSGLPARRKFLKSAAGELRRCAAFIREYAVCNPDIAFTLEHDGKTIFTSDGSGSREKILAKIWDAGVRIQNITVKIGHTELECWFQSRAGLAARSDVIAFVNGRAVNDPAIKSAVGQVSRELAGNWAMFFTLDPSLVDVNIHPAKSEVRFRYPNEIYDAVHKAARHLGSPAAMPEILSVPSQPRSDIPAREPARNFTPYAAGGSPSRSPSYTGRAEPVQNTFAFTGNFNDDSPEGEKLPAHDVIYLGQSSAGYLVFDNRDAIIIMDPHAGHERVNYERVKRLAESSHNVQALIEPVILSPTLAVAVHEFEDALKASGFELENTINGVALKAVPAIGDVDAEPEVLLRASLQALRQERSGNIKEALWRRWATMACKASVKLTTGLSREEALRLWREVHECEQPNVCPHGRPVMIELSNADLLKRFGRE